MQIVSCNVLTGSLTKISPPDSFMWAGGLLWYKSRQLLAKEQDVFIFYHFCSHFSTYLYPNTHTHTHTHTQGVWVLDSSEWQCSTHWERLYFNTLILVVLKPTNLTKDSTDFCTISAVVLVPDGSNISLHRCFHCYQKENIGSTCTLHIFTIFIALTRVPNSISTLLLQFNKKFRSKQQ